MDRVELFQQVVSRYELHGWKLTRVLLTGATLAELRTHLPAEVAVKESDIDALWFARPSHAGREAWELRLFANIPYALFEAFESDETEEDREDARMEMENKLREYLRPVNGGGS
jgi:hypothetical protein